MPLLIFLYAVSRTPQGRQREPSIRFRSAPFLTFCRIEPVNKPLYSTFFPNIILKSNDTVTVTNTYITNNYMKIKIKPISTSIHNQSHQTSQTGTFTCKIDTSVHQNRKNVKKRDRKNVTEIQPPKN